MDFESPQVRESALNAIDIGRLKDDLRLVESSIPADLALDVKQLSYTYNNFYIATKTFFSKYNDYFRYLPYNFLLRRLRSNYAKLASVSFRARPGRLTAVVGSSEAEIETLLDLIGGRRKTGSYDGDIVIAGLPHNANYLDSVAYVRNVSLSFDKFPKFQKLFINIYYIFCIFILFSVEIYANDSRLHLRRDSHLLCHDSDAL